MGARLSPEWEEAGATAAQAEALRRRVAPLARRDAEAYANVLRIRAEPEGLDPAIRDFALGEALIAAANLPLRIAEAAADVAELALATAQAGEPSVRGDLIGAATLAAAAARVSATLVAVNLRTTEEDERLDQVRIHAHVAAQAAQRALELAG
jgi:formiminotetrahydrofolate cyclodeaminase